MADKDEIKDDAELKNFIMDALKSINSRMDALEAADKAKADAMKADAEEKAKADKARKDAEEEAEKKAKEDKAKKDAEAEEDPEKAKAEQVAADKKRKDAEDEEAKKKADAEEEERRAIKERMDALERELPKSSADEDAEAMCDAQAKAAEVYAMHALKEPVPMRNETVGAYRRRAAKGLQAYADSEHTKKANLAAIHDEASFAIVEGIIYADAVKRANDPIDLPPGQLRARTRRSGGHEITEYTGQPSAWMDSLAGPQRLYVNGFGA